MYYKFIKPATYWIRVCSNWRIKVLEKNCLNQLRNFRFFFNFTPFELRMGHKNRCNAVNFFQEHTFENT